MQGICHYYKVIYNSNCRVLHRLFIDVIAMSNCSVITLIKFHCGQHYRAKKNQLFCKVHITLHNYEVSAQLNVLAKCFNISYTLCVGKLMQFSFSFLIFFIFTVLNAPVYVEIDYDIQNVICIVA